MAPFAISPVHLEDLPAINTIIIEVFYKGERTMARHFFPDIDENLITNWSFRTTQHEFNQSDDSYYDKLVDEPSGKIAGFAVWQLPRQKGSPEDQSKRETDRLRLDKEFKKVEQFPEGGNRRLVDDFDKEIERMREEYVDTEKDYVLKMIAVLPEYQGQGCGAKLMKHGLEIVDAAGARVELEATSQGKPIYERFGWREIDQIVFDLGEYGRQGTQVTTCMMRENKTLVA